MTPEMSKERLADIKRHNDICLTPFDQAVIRECVAEIERLRAELEKMRGDDASTSPHYCPLCIAKDDKIETWCILHRLINTLRHNQEGYELMKKEIDELESENEVLRASLQEKEQEILRLQSYRTRLEHDA